MSRILQSLSCSPFRILQSLSSYRGTSHPALQTLAACLPVRGLGTASPYDTEYEPSATEPVQIVHKLGIGILNDPWWNKGSAFPASERERLGLRGLLPPCEMPMAAQVERFMYEYSKGAHIVDPEQMGGQGVSSEMARKWMALRALQDRNEQLFFKVLIDNFEEMSPIVYTPTVGWACVNYHKLYRRPRGMYFSAEDRGFMAAMAYNWPQDDVHAIVVTDGSRILGLGDLGINGLGIPVGKLDLYCAAAGFSPSKVLPCVIDVGCNNAHLRQHPLYLGIDRARATGDEYLAIVDEFVQAVMARWPKAVLQFEDFSISNALPLLERYRQHHLVFNDDIQGTACTALAGLYGALRVVGLQLSDLARQRVVCVGAGSAGMGVVSMIAAGMQKQGLTAEQASSNFWVMDAQGLITEARPDLPAHVAPFARPGSEAAHEGERLLELVQRVKPTVLLGLAGAGHLFSEPVVRAVSAGCRAAGVRPIIFPMSNPTGRMECTGDEAIAWSEGSAVVASGSPQPPVEFNGRTYRIGQANNMYLFPGVALGAFLGETRTISDAMLMAAAETLPRLVSDEDLALGLMYPRLKDIRTISATVAVEVIKAAADEGRLLSAGARNALRCGGDEELYEWVCARMFRPTYGSLAYLPPGIGE